VALRVARRREEPELGGVLVAAGGDGGGLVALRLARLHQRVEVELVRVPFAVDLGHDVLVVVVPGKRSLHSYRTFSFDVFDVFQGQFFISNNCSVSLIFPLINLLRQKVKNDFADKYLTVRLLIDLI
jgi:hypothetical protein